MKLYNYVQRAFVGVFALALLIACNEDFGEVGSGLVDEINFETNFSDNFAISAYTMDFPEGVQTNALTAGSFGFYRDNVYGNTTVNVLAQVALSRANPDFGDNPVLDSVYFTLPYFSTREDTDAEGANTYSLDSVFGDRGPMKLSLYRSNFFLNTLDPDSNFEDPAVYYSDDVQNFAGVEGDLLFELDNFKPSNEEIVLYEFDSIFDTNDVFDRIDTTIVRTPPALRVKLDSTYFAQNFIEREGNAELLNANNFTDYFRGVYLKAEPIDNSGSFIIFNLGGATIEMNYKFDGSDDSQDPGDPSDDGKGNLRLNIGGVQVLDIQNEFDSGILSDIAAADPVNGDESLYVKGGSGSIALVDLFGPDFDNDGIEDQLELLRSCNVIVNEANLILYVDQEKMAAGAGIPEPERVFVYDFDNNRNLRDAGIDGTVGNNGPVGTRINHLGRLARETEGDETSAGKSYRIRITQHINDIINNDSTDVRLGIAVSQNVTINAGAIIGGTIDDEVIKRVPVTTIIAPEGTILHGNRSANEDKRLKLRLYYTLTDDINPDSPCGRLLGLE